ncbi:hypothetical protein CQT90_16650 [Salmonella enterica]|nr:hypothetical protein [Salmonella enterica]ECX8200053.1 hypothetical protein [Salmonella enterica]ELE6319726.1 hypothetical protein [Salmonella enterica]
MSSLIKSVLLTCSLLFSSFCPAAMFSTSNDTPAVTFPLIHQDNIHEGFKFVLRAYFTGSLGIFHSWSSWPGYERCDNDSAEVVGAWSLAIPRKIITNGVTLEVYGLADGGGGIPSKTIELGNGKQNMWVFWPYPPNSFPSGLKIICRNFVHGQTSIGNGTMDLWVRVVDISADHNPGNYSISIDTEASYNMYEANTSIINNDALFRQVSMSNINKRQFVIPFSFSTNSSCSVSESELIFDHGTLKPDEIDASKIDKYIELSCSALYAQGRARLYFDNTVGTDHKDLKINHSEINAKISVDRTDVLIPGGSKELIKITSQLSKLSNRVHAGPFSGSTVLTVEWL